MNKISSKIHANATTMLEAGVQYNAGSWKPVASGDFSKSFKGELSVAGEANAEIRLIPEIKIRFYRVLSGSLFIEPSIKGEGKIELITNGDLLADIFPIVSQVRKFDFSLGGECFAAINFEIFTKKFPLLKKTKILGPWEYPLISLPEITLNGNTNAKAGEEVVLTMDVAGGINNPFDHNSVKWFVYPKSAHINANGTKATFTAYQKGEYTVFASGYGDSLLGEAARQFEKTVIVVEDEEDNDNEKLNACFTASPSSVSADITVELDASCSSEEQWISYYQWNSYPDGREWTTLYPRSSITYKEEGDYTILLTISDSYRNTDSAQQAVKVYPRPWIKITCNGGTSCDAPHSETTNLEVTYSIPGPEYNASKIELFGCNMWAISYKHDVSENPKEGKVNLPLIHYHGNCNTSTDTCVHVLLYDDKGGQIATSEYITVNLIGNQTSPGWMPCDFIIDN